MTEQSLPWPVIIIMIMPPRSDMPLPNDHQSSVPMTEEEEEEVYQTIQGFFLDLDDDH